MIQKILIIGVAVAFTPAIHAGNNSLLAISPTGKRLLTANSDNHSVSVVDTEDQKTLLEIPVGKQPESVAWLANGPLAVATFYRDSEVVVFDTATGKMVHHIKTANEPYGLVVTKTGNRAYVTNEFPGLVSEIDLEKGQVKRTLKVGPYLRGIAIYPDESKLLVVGFYDAKVYAIDLQTWKVVDTWEPSSKTDNLARQICIHPKLPLAYVPHLRSRVERALGSASIFPFVTILDLSPVKAGELRRHPIAMDQFNRVDVPSNPWEIAISPDGNHEITLYAGTDDANICEVLDDNYRYLKPRGGLEEVGRNPRAAIFSPDSQTVYVYNTLDFKVAKFRVKPFRFLKEIKVCEPPYSPSMTHGKQLFNSALPPMTRRKWISCSSCHPDGDHDGRVWQQAEGLRRTTPFFAMSRTYPLHWSADRDELQDFELTIRGPLMQGRGLINGPVHEALGLPNAGRSAGLDALAEYCNSIEPPLSPFAAGPGKLSPSATRGKAIFLAAKTQCATCHSGPEYTDRKVHDVGTGRDDSSEKVGFLYDTPTLLRVYRNLVWMHDGSRKSLTDVITNNPGDKHGVTSHLQPAEVEDLVHFLESLPFEPTQATKKLASEQAAGVK